MAGDSGLRSTPLALPDFSGDNRSGATVSISGTGATGALQRLGGGGVVVAAFRGSAGLLGLGLLRAAASEVVATGGVATTPTTMTMTQTLGGGGGGTSTAGVAAGDEEVKVGNPTSAPQPKTPVTGREGEGETKDDEEEDSEEEDVKEDEAEEVDLSPPGLAKCFALPLIGWLGGGWHDGAVSGLSVCCGGGQRLAATCCEADGTVRLWDYRKGACVLRHQWSGGFGRTPLAVSLHPSGHKLLVGFEDR